MLLTLIAVVLVFGVVRPFILEVFYLPSASMFPTLEIGDRVLVNKFLYRFANPSRGDIVVFESSGVESGQELIRRAVRVEGDTELIKRVVGVAGDSVEVEKGVLYINGEAQEEPYINRQPPDESDYGPIEVEEGKVFVMGDNRAGSLDSRALGPIPIDDLVGKAFVRIWPLGRLGGL